MNVLSLKLLESKIWIDIVQVGKSMYRIMMYDCILIHNGESLWLKTKTYFKLKENIGR